MIQLNLYNKLLLNIILLLILIITILTIKTLNFNKKNIVYKQIFIEDIYQNIKPGDLILFSSYSYSNFTRLLGDLTFPHIGIVVKENNILSPTSRSHATTSHELYILEMLKKEYFFSKDEHTEHILYKNINKFKLIDRITDYPGFIYISSLVTPLKEEQEKLLNSYNINITYPTFKENILKLFYTNNNKQHCSEFIGNMLTKANIYDLSNTSVLNYHNKILKLCNGEIYTEPIRLLTKKNIIDNILKNNHLNYC